MILNYVVSENNKLYKYIQNINVSPPDRDTFMSMCLNRGIVLVRVARGHTRPIGP